MKKITTLSEFPPPPSNKTGWPWTEMSDLLPERKADGKPWPRLTVVTPSYNQGQFIEETIRSVLLQGYPNLEYMVIDGGSTDNSTQIIRKYQDYLAYWVSEPDRGQSHAINKGFQRSTGDVLVWLNSDDVYEPNVFGLVAETLDPSAGVPVVFGDCLFTDETGAPVNVGRGIDKPFYRKLCYWIGWDIYQPTAFVARQVLEQVGPLDESLRLALDYEWFLRIAAHYSFKHLRRTVARYRLHTRAKTGDFAANRFAFYQEQHPISQRYWPTLPLHQQALVRFSYGYFRFRQFIKAVIRPGR